MGFYLYKGLKKPIVFFGLKGKYIFQALGGIGIGVVSTFIFSKFGIFGTLIGVAIVCSLVFLVFKRQDAKGLYDKTKNDNEIFIFPIIIKSKHLKKNKHE